MANEDFTYDAETFVVGESGVNVQKLEADYAELFVEALASGPIGKQARERLDRAAATIGLPPGRIAQIEQALSAEQDAQRKTVRAIPAPRPSVSDPVLADVGAPPDDKPLGLSIVDETTDPRLHALYSRIAALEAENAALVARNRVLEERILGLTVNLDLTDVVASRGAAATGERSAQGSGAAKREPSPAELDARIEKDPRDLDALHGLFRVLRRGADADRRWRVAHALVHLNAADDDERRIEESGRPAGVIQPSRAITTEEWHELVVHPDQEPLVGEIFTEVSPAVLLARVATARRAAAAPAGAAASPGVELATRCVAWSAAVLGVTAPPVQADPAFSGIAEMVFATPPAVRLGRAAIDGRAPRELAFAVGRHLTWYRRQHVMSVLAASLEALEDLFLAALSIGNPGLPMAADVKRRVDPVASAIEPLLEPSSALRLRAAFLKFVEMGGKTNLRRWAKASDRTACRAGLLLAGDLSAARTMLDIEDAARADDRMSDLLEFWLGARMGTLRANIGVAAS
jgi:hypothetical protein